MPQLNRSRHHEQGSILVGAVAIAVLITLAGVGFLQVTTSSLNAEIRSLEYEQSFHVAESGVFLAATWLSGQVTFPGIMAATNPFGSNAISIGGMDLRVTVVPNAGTTNSARIVSEVYKDRSGGGARNATTFLKRITVGNVQAQSVTKYSTFYDGYIIDPDATGNLNWGGFRNRTFNGPTHINAIYIRLAPTAFPGGGGDVVFNGPVTVAQNAINDIAPNRYGHQNYGIGHYGNNYNWGVQATWANPTVSQLDGVFKNTYVSNATPISLNSVRTDGTSIAAAVLPGVSKVLLDVSARDEGSDYNHYRPTLRFDISMGQPRYTFEYTDNNGKRVQRQATYTSNTVFIASNNINVYGTVRGKMTIATRTGFDICPIGNLTVEGYDINNTDAKYGVAESNPNIIGLASGRRIKFIDQWVRHFSTDPAPTTPTVTGTNNLLHITASLLAMNTWVSADNMQKGCLAFDITDLGIGHTGRPMQCGVKISGNQIVRAYRALRDGTSTTGLATQPFIINEDTRFTEQNQAPPGFPVYMTNAINNRLIIFLDSWSESNTL